MQTMEYFIVSTCKLDTCIITDMQIEQQKKLLKK